MLFTSYFKQITTYISEPLAVIYLSLAVVPERATNVMAICPKACRAWPPGNTGFTNPHTFFQKVSERMNKGDLASAVYLDFLKALLNVLTKSFRSN